MRRLRRSLLASERHAVGYRPVSPLLLLVTEHGRRVIQFTVYGLSAPGGSKTAGVSKAGKSFVRDSSKRSAPWKRQVAEKAAEAMNGTGLLEGPLEATFTFIMPRPQGHYGKKGIRPSAPPHPVTRPDVLKLARVVEDACSGICYRDDSQIVDEHLFKRYGDPVRCEITIRPLFP